MVAVLVSDEYDVGGQIVTLAFIWVDIYDAPVVGG
jgi:hypothetical protein